MNRSSTLTGDICVERKCLGVLQSEHSPYRNKSLASASIVVGEVPDEPMWPPSTLICSSLDTRKSTYDQASTPFHGIGSISIRKVEAPGTAATRLFSVSCSETLYKTLEGVP